MKRERKFKTAEFGSVSTATMRPEDLIPCFTAELRYLGHRSRELSRIERHTGAKYFVSEEASWDLDSLFDMLQEHAPAYAYFGSHPGDGSDYGFWLDDGFEYDFDGLKVSDTSQVPADYNGEVLQVSDHGNITLYSCKRGKLTEIWALV